MVVSSHEMKKTTDKVIVEVTLWKELMRHILFNRGGRDGQ